MADSVLVVIGVGEIGTALARRPGTGRQLVLADRDHDALNELKATLATRATR